MDIKQLLAEAKKLSFNSTKEFLYISEIYNALRKAQESYLHSSAYLNEMQLETEQASKRAEQRRARERARIAEVKKWVKDGLIKPGVFVKVGGTRDGKGIREVLAIKKEGNHVELQCLKWQPTHFKKSESYMVNEGCIKLGDMWIERGDYLTTHYVEKVQKILS